MLGMFFRDLCAGVSFCRSEVLMRAGNWHKSPAMLKCVQLNFPPAFSETDCILVRI